MAIDKVTMAAAVYAGVHANTSYTAIWDAFASAFCTYITNNMTGGSGGHAVNCTASATLATAIRSGISGGAKNSPAAIYLPLSTAIVDHLQSSNTTILTGTLGGTPAHTHAVISGMTGSGMSGLITDSISTLVGDIPALINVPGDSPTKVWEAICTGIVDHIHNVAVTGINSPIPPTSHTHSLV